MGESAWVTLATNDSYSLGALVLAHSLKQVGTAKKLAILVTPGVSNAMRSALSQAFDAVLEVNVLDSKDQANLKLLQRPDLGVTFTKLHCWRLIQFEKCVFLDADTLVLRNCDELFEREELSAAPDVGWPDCFNSGVFVYKPSLETYEKLIDFALTKGSFDGGDQGLLNMFFSDWAHKDISKHLPFIYNMCSTALYSYLPAFKQFGGNAKIVHFIGTSKPWLVYFDTESKTVRPSGDLQHLQPILQKWWDIFCNFVHPGLSPDMSGIAAAYSQLTLGVPRSAEQSALEDQFRRQGWETGNIDYSGRDSFDNIWSKICQTIAPSEPSQPSPPVESPEKPSTPPVQTQPIQPEVIAKPAPITPPQSPEKPSTPTAEVSAKPATLQSPEKPSTPPIQPAAQAQAPLTQPASPTPVQAPEKPSTPPVAQAPLTQPEVCTKPAPSTPVQSPEKPSTPPVQSPEKPSTPPVQPAAAQIPLSQAPQPEVCSKPASSTPVQSPAKPSTPVAEIPPISPEVCAKPTPVQGPPVQTQVTAKPSTPVQAAPSQPEVCEKPSTPVQAPPVQTQVTAKPSTPVQAPPSVPEVCAKPLTPAQGPPQVCAKPSTPVQGPPSQSQQQKPGEQAKPKEAAKPAQAEQAPSGKSKKKK